MPILDVELVGELDAPHPELARRLADAAGAIFKSGRQTTWVKLRRLAPDSYAENGGALPDGVLPVFVSVLKRQTPDPGSLRAEIGELTQAIATLCGRPKENVHILYEPPAAGRVAFGGTLAE